MLCCLPRPRRLPPPGAAARHNGTGPLQKSGRATIAVMVVAALFCALVARLAIAGSDAVGIVAAIGGVLLVGAFAMVGKGPRRP